MAHMGVLRILEEERIPVDLIVGTSIGSLIGSLYCMDPRIESVIQKVTRFLNSEKFREIRIHQLRKSEGEDSGILDSLSSLLAKGLFFRSSVTKRSYISYEEIEDVLNSLIDNVNIEDLKIPFACVATDLDTGEVVVLDRGPLRRAVAASSSIPGVFPPIKVNGAELVDGGSVSLVPVPQARDLGADVVVAVDISAALDPAAELDRGYEIILRTTEISKHQLVKFQIQEADVVIAPRVGRIHWADFSNAQACIKLGEAAAAQALPAIRNAASRAGRRKILPWARDRRMRKGPGVFFGEEIPEGAIE